MERKIIYGTHKLGPLKDGELQIKPRNLQRRIDRLHKTFFGIDFNNTENSFASKRDLNKLFNLFQILMFSKDKYPYMLSLSFDKIDLFEGSYNLLAINVFKDPHYKYDEQLPSAFQGRIFPIKSLPDLHDNPQLLIEKIKEYVITGVIKNGSPTVCIGGTYDSTLCVGIPKKDFFVGMKPVRTYNKPIILNK